MRKYRSSVRAHRWLRRSALGLSSLLVAVVVAALPVTGSRADRPLTYAALGDSVAAGLGLPLHPQASADDVRCGRSYQAYPLQVVAATGMRIQHVACSGAQINRGVYDSQTVGSVTLASQLDQAFAAGRPDVITLTIGANDMRWGQFVQSCYASNCAGLLDKTAAGALRIGLQYKLAKLMESIRQRSGNQLPAVYVTGYFAPYGPADCADTSRLTAAEKTWLNTQTQAIDTVIARTATQYSFARYVPLDFSGHELCSADPWIQGLAAAAPYHPTAAGQAAIARAIVTVMNQ